jgi:hypothetical protein
VSAPAISGSALTGSRLDLIRERVANSDRDELYAPAYGDRRYLLNLVDVLAEALRVIRDTEGTIHWWEYQETARSALAKLSPTSPSADHRDSSRGESGAI